MNSLGLSEVLRLRPLKPGLYQLRTMAIGRHLLLLQGLRGQWQAQGKRGGVKKADAGGQEIGGVWGAVRRVASHLGDHKTGHGERLLD